MYFYAASKDFFVAIHEVNTYIAMHQVANVITTLTNQLIISQSMAHITELTENIPNWTYYPQLGISNPQSGIISNWGLGIKESGNTESEKKLDKISPICGFK